MFKRIDHVELVPSQFDVTLEFYTGVLGFKERERISIEGHPPLRQVAYLELGGTVLELLDFQDPEPWAGPAPRVGYRMLALEVDSMDDALAYLENHGIRPTLGPFDAGGSLRAEINDPDGLPIELRQW
ncbi:MAG TPA: VOC family protein [Thermoleophilia bacterium]|nr:VOC family protein [Thermoleophilia bacterium]